jgi:epoxyqueuosine reductase
MDEITATPLCSESERVPDGPRTPQAAIAETNEYFTRFSGKDMFALYPLLKEEHDGEGSFMAENTATASRLSNWMRNRKPGFGLRDQQLSSGAWTLMRTTTPGAGLLSWTRIQTSTPSELGIEPFSAPPREMADTVKAAARFYGAGSVGIAPMQEAYVNQREGEREIVFDDAELPTVTEDKFVIPRKMQWVVVIAIPMDLTLLSQSPAVVGEAATSLGYSQSVLVVASLAEFIRGLGYQAIPSINDTAQSVPFAFEAGLGELGRMNKLFTPQFGAAVRLCKVLTDMPMECDKPSSFGVEELCRQCKLCAEACPSRALSFDDEPSFNTRGPWNNPGHKAWFEDSYRCFSYWRKVGNGCAICLASCPYTKATFARTRDHVPLQDPGQWWNRAKFAAQM